MSARQSNIGFVQNGLLPGVRQHTIARLEQSNSFIIVSFVQSFILKIRVVHCLCFFRLDYNTCRPLRCVPREPLLPALQEALLVLGSWVGVRRPFYVSLFLTASRMVLPQDPGTDPFCCLFSRLEQQLQLTASENLQAQTAVARCLQLERENTELRERRGLANNIQYNPVSLWDSLMFGRIICK